MNAQVHCVPDLQTEQARLSKWGSFLSEDIAKKNLFGFNFFQTGTMDVLVSAQNHNSRHSLRQVNTNPLPYLIFHPFKK